MTDEERDRAFRAERKRQAPRMTRIQRDTLAEIDRLLRLSLASIDKQLAGQPSDWRLWQLPRLRLAVARQLEELGSAGGQALGAGAELSWQAGQDLLDRPLAAAGFDLAPQLPRLDRAQLEGMKAMLTDRMKGVGTQAADRVNQELGLVVTGLQTPDQATTAIARIVKKGGRARAITLVRTELGTAYSAAHQARQLQAAELLPGLRKQWRRSGKRHSRIDHDAADGQIREVPEPFIIASARLMYPRDPEAPIGHRINCGCTSLPFMDSWTVTDKGKRAFTAAEIDADPRKRNIADAMGQTGYPPARPRPGLVGTGSQAVRREQIRRLEATDPKVAGARVAALVQDDAFHKFVAGADPGDFPIAILPDHLKTALGSSAQVVRLSRSTLNTHQHHTLIGPAEYAGLQNLLAKGEARLDPKKPNHLILIAEPHYAVVKATADGKELFLQSLRITDPKRAAKRRRKTAAISYGEE